MQHSRAGDIIQPRDCILLKAGPRKTDLPFVAKVSALWENPEDGTFSMLQIPVLKNDEALKLLHQLGDLPQRIVACMGIKSQVKCVGRGKAV